MDNQEHDETDEYEDRLNPEDILEVIDVDEYIGNNDICRRC